MIQIHIAKSSEEFDAAIQLVMRTYTEAGYIDAGQSINDSISAYIGKNHTTTFLTAHNDTVLGTISVVRDTTHGLPMDVIYKDELDVFRTRGNQIAEVCQFATDQMLLKKLRSGTKETVSELDISMKLLGLVVHYGIKENYKYLCFAVNPKHASFYESLGCLKIGEEKQYPSVNQAPAYAYILDVIALKNLDLKNSGRGFLIEKILETLPEPGFFQ